MLRISTLNGRQRMSTQELLLKISDAVQHGETEFFISASGQHDIGGPLWNNDGKPLNFQVMNPGQRVGSMCLPGTRVIVEGAAPADAGWLNSGGEVIIRGDAGDTAGHCAAGGKIFIGGRAGTRSGSLMKHDPLHEPPELWILKNTGSFSFEFMGGGRAVVCGYDSLTLPSALGMRPGVGMVGGVIYFRGKCPELPDDVRNEKLSEEDIAFLDGGLDEFLEAIGKPGLKRDLSFWKHWSKLVPTGRENAKKRLDMAAFHAGKWFPDGLFGDVLKDDQRVISLVPTGVDRMHGPEWDNRQEKCVDCRHCLKGCPRGAVLRRTRQEADCEKAVYDVNAGRCIGCGICAAVCPAHVWVMRNFAG